MALRLTYFGTTSVPVEVEGFTPDWAHDKSLAAIERFEIFHGNQKIPLAELFKVSGDPGDQQFHFEGNLAGVHWLGAHLHTGSIQIHGPAGRHVGSDMRGGQIVVHGNVGTWVGGEMHGGSIHVKGNAEHLVGAAYRGSIKGMTGGRLLVDGDAGNEIGLCMRRGLIAIGGTVKDMLGFGMLAGTILAFGECGIRAGAEMRRGTIGLFGARRPPLLPTFRYATTGHFQYLRMLLAELDGHGLKFDPALIDEQLDFYHGDFLSHGRGELIFRHAATA